MSLVSIIIPAYNAQKYIQKCLKSLLNQTFKDFEIIVVDDGSSDNTADFALPYAKVIKLPKNMGVGFARNKGAKEAKGRILVFTDADIVAPETWLENILNIIKKYNVKCVGSGYCGSLGNSFIERFAYLELVYRRKKFYGFVNTLVANNFACFKEVFVEIGGFPEKFICEDLRFSYKISRKYPIYWDKNNGVYHHFKDNLKDYLKQQYYFARDTVFSYYQYPSLLFNRTHQGRTIYLEILLMFLTIISLPISFWFFLFFISSIIIINFGLLDFLKKNDLGSLRSISIILLRDFICLIGVAEGFILCFIDILRRLIKFKKYENFNH